MGDITQLLDQARAGDAGAQNALFARVHDELKRLAQNRLAQGAPVTLLDPTSLVQETYLRMVAQIELPGVNRYAFFAYAARVMRSVIVTYVRNNQAEKRGGREIHVTLTAAQVSSQLREPELIQLDLALDELAKFDVRAHEIVELRYFAGLSIEEIAELTTLSPATVKRSWQKARAFLYKAMEA